MLFSDKMEWVNNTNHGYATTRLAFKGIMVRESIQSQRLHYCMTPFIRYSGIELSGLESGGVWHKFWGVVRWLCIFTVVLVPEIYACMKTYRPVYHHHYQILFIICKFRRYSSWIILITRSTVVNKAGTWVISHSVVCSLTAENTKVPPPGHHRCCQLVWQSALTG